MNNDDRKFMQMAIAKTRQGIKKGQTPFGACIVLKGTVVACEHNVVWKTTDITAHGEINAIRKACKNLKTIDLSNCVLYSTCEPCPMCFAAIHWARIKKVIYGAGIKDARKAGFHELSISNQQMKRIGKSEVVVEGGFMLEECRELFEEWISAPGHKTY